MVIINNVLVRLKGFYKKRKQQNNYNLSPKKNLTDYVFGAWKSFQFKTPPHRV